MPAALAKPMKFGATIAWKTETTVIQRQTLTSRFLLLVAMASNLLAMALHLILSSLLSNRCLQVGKDSLKNSGLFFVPNPVATHGVLP